jgi:hypothetical protein
MLVLRRRALPANCFLVEHRLGKVFPGPGWLVPLLPEWDGLMGRDVVDDEPNAWAGGGSNPDKEVNVLLLEPRVNLLDGLVAVGPPALFDGSSFWPPEVMMRYVLI